MANVKRVLIVRDRLGAGGGIHAYFEAIRPHLTCTHKFCDTGRSHGCYGERGALRWTASSIRLVADWLRLAWEILWFHPGLVHLNAGFDREERSLKREAVSVRIARLLRCPVLVFWHGWDHPAKGGSEFPGGRGGWLWKSYAMSAGHVVLSSKFADDLKRWGFVAPVHVANTVVPAEILGWDAGQSSASGKSLLFLSRVERAKGLWELLEAYALLKAGDPEYRLVIAGDGPDLAALKQRSAELGLADVSFPGFVFGDEKRKCLSSAAIFCFPSHSEGMPLAMLEALAVGLPVVSSAVGGLGDILSDGEHGILLNLLPEDSQGRRFDPAEIVGAIKRLSDDPKLRSEIAHRNAQYARERFSPEEGARQVEVIYQRLGRCLTSQLEDESAVF